MSVQENKETVLRAVAALGEGDIEGFLADASDDFLFTLGGNPPGGNTLQGKQPMIDFLKTLFGSRLERSAIAMTNEGLVGEGDVVVEQARGQAKTLAGEPYDNEYCRVWRFRGGKIVALTEYMDTELARRCLWTN